MNATTKKSVMLAVLCAAVVSANAAPALDQTPKKIVIVDRLPVHQLGAWWFRGMIWRVWP